MLFNVNTSPMAGQDGNRLTSSMLTERLETEVRYINRLLIGVNRLFDGTSGDGGTLC